MVRRRSGAPVKVVLASRGKKDVRGHWSLRMGFLLYFEEIKYRRGDKGLVEGVGDGDVSGSVSNRRKWNCLEGSCGLEE